MYDLATFGLADLLDCSSGLRHLGEQAGSMEGAARAVVRFLYEELIDKNSGQRALSLVRLYKTVRYEDLEAEVRASADAMGEGESLAGRPCLSLLASAGEEPAWNDRHRSKQHRAIPLASAAALQRSPMVSQLVRQLGFDPSDVLEPDPTLFRRNHDRPCGVFYVPDALGSPHVPAQDDFVARFNIRSALGFGGVLPSGYVFAVVMFSKVEIPASVADSFASMAFSVQLALLPFVGRRLFDSDPPSATPPEPDWELTISRAQATALGHLLDARQDVALEQALRLQQALGEAEERAEALARSQRQLALSEATKSAILDASLDCVITMDADGRIVDFNPAAERTFGYRREDVLGRVLGELIVPERLRAAHAAGLRRYLSTGKSKILGRRIEISARRYDGSEFPVELTVTEARVDGTLLFSAYVRDITEQLRAQQALIDAGQRYAGIARSLQASLLPPALPAIPRADVASVYRAASEGIDVGGDFYDVFQVGPDDWGIVLGDVMGKGAEAAAVTALARYTIRAAAMRTRRPSRVLSLLNEAIDRHHTDRFCTVIYARLRLGSPSLLTVASGGHPSALVRSEAGVVPLVSEGMLLGPFPDWRGTDQRVSLHPGDMVVLYSDGVTEARRGTELFGSERLVALLGANPHLDAQATVDLIDRNVADFADAPRDDVAIVALRLTDG